MTDAAYIRQTLGQLLEGQGQLKADVAEIKDGYAGMAVYAQETRRRVDRNTTFARGVAWTSATLFTALLAVIGYMKS